MKVNNLYKLGITFSLMSLLSGCAEDRNTGILMATGAGGVVGAAAGHTMFGNGAGAMIGTVIGAAAGGMLAHKMMTKEDKIKQDKIGLRALEYNEDGQTSRWDNPNTRHYGTITPRRTYVDRYGHNCREFTQKVNIGGKYYDAVGHACRRDDGTWDIVENSDQRSNNHYNDRYNDRYDDRYVR